MSNSVVSQTAVSPSTFTTKSKKKKHHHHKHKHHHRKHRHKTSELPMTEQATASYTATATAAVLPDAGQTNVSTSRTTTLDSTKTTPESAISTDNYFNKETPTSLLSITAMSFIKTSTSSLSRPTSRLLTPPRDHPMRDTRPLSSSLIIPPSPSIIQPIPANATTSSSSTRPPAPTITHTNGNNADDDDNTAYHHKAQIQSSNRDLGLGLGLGFGGFSILALTALLIQNYKKRKRNQDALRTSNHIDNNGVFFTEKPSMFKRKSASRRSKQSSFISNKWRPQSFLAVIAAKFSKRGSSNSFAQFGESGTVEYDPLTYPQPLYSPVKATYQDM